MNKTELKPFDISKLKSTFGLNNTQMEKNKRNTKQLKSTGSSQVDVKLFNSKTPFMKDVAEQVFADTFKTSSGNNFSLRSRSVLSPAVATMQAQTPMALRFGQNDQVSPTKLTNFEKRKMSFTSARRSSLPEVKPLGYI